MEKIEIAPVDVDAKVREKRAYEGMSLIRYGCISALTQAGTACELTDNFNPGTCFFGMNSMNARYSDRGVKENIVRVGVHPLGFGLYLFDYKPAFRDQCGHARQFGVIAQEVEKVIPAAVKTHANGYKMVDYGMLGISPAVQ